MDKLTYKIEIAAPAKKVWYAMLDEDTYKIWTDKSWPGSSYKGKWKKGEEISFVGHDDSGTLAELLEVKPYEKVTARHIAILIKGVQDKTSKEAQGWIGIIEDYQFTEQGGKTTVTVTIETKPDWKEMFDSGWPVALEELKKLAEG